MDELDFVPSVLRAGEQLAELDTHDGRRVRLPASYLDGRTGRGGPTIDHGYAITGHKSQGMTTGRAFVLGTEELYREWGYVALSRGRLENRLYVVAPEPHERDEYAPHEPRRDPLEAITGALGRSRAQHMELDVDEQLRLAALPSNELRGRLDELDSAPARRDLTQPPSARSTTSSSSTQPRPTQPTRLRSPARTSSHTSASESFGQGLQNWHAPRPLSKQAAERARELASARSN